MDSKWTRNRLNHYRALDDIHEHTTKFSHKFIMDKASIDVMLEMHKWSSVQNGRVAVKVYLHKHRHAFHPINRIMSLFSNWKLSKYDYYFNIVKPKRKIK